MGPGGTDQIATDDIDQLPARISVGRLAERIVSDGSLGIVPRSWTSDRAMSWLPGPRTDDSCWSAERAVLAELHGMFSASEQGAVERLLAWRREEDAREEAELRSVERR